MKVEILIKKLKELPANTDVCIVDYRKNLHHANGDEEDPSNGIGIQEKFRVEYYTKNVNKPFAGLDYKNDSYDDIGNSMNIH